MNAKRLNTLTSLRFFAAAMIVLLHMDGTFWPTVGLQGFTTGVSFFFILSGFILRLVYGELHSAAEIRSFYVARIARIWPMHFLSTLVLVLAAGEALPSWNILAANLLLVQSWVPHPDWYFSMNGVAWSISTEFAFYAVFPILSWKLEKTWRVKVLFTVGGIVACALIYPLMRPENSADALLVLAGLLYINPISRVFEFLVGILAATVYKKVRATVSGGRVVWTAAELLVCVIVAACVMRAWPTYQAIEPFSPQLAEWILQSGQFWALSLLIFVFAIGRGALSWWLSSRPFVFLGEISFAMYMLHQVVIKAMETHLRDFMFDQPALSTAVYLVVVLLSSSAAFVLFEKPTRNFILSKATARFNSGSSTKQTEQPTHSSQN